MLLWPAERARISTGSSAMVSPAREASASASGSG